MFVSKLTQNPAEYHREYRKQHPYIHPKSDTQNGYRSTAEAKTGRGKAETGRRKTETARGTAEVTGTPKTEQNTGHCYHDLGCFLTYNLDH